jgi:cephalosporin hydroxylase
MTNQEKTVVDNFHNLYYNGPEGTGPIFARTYWFNTPCLKCPLDLWIYQEIIAEIRPDLIIETGTHLGGSALFMAHMLDILDNGEVITIDIAENVTRPIHPRIRYVKGSSVDSVLINSLLRSRPEETRLVILDSDHTKHHVSNELEIFAPYVSVGSYIIVEDTNINGHPTYASFGEGSFEAVEEFLSCNQNFTSDRSREKFLMTFNPRGYLKRIA